MLKPKEIPNVPVQEKGSFHDTESVKFFDHQDLARTNYQILKDRFLSVNYWDYYSKSKGAEFKLHTKEGILKKRLPEIGDFIRIDIPGPGNFEARGYDWVEITDLYSEEFINGETLESYVMVCRPSGVPGKDDTHTAHFYGSDATSTFIISRGEDFIKFGVYGRNESPNLDANIADKARNLMIALGGMVGLSKIQWQILTDSLVDF
ncbi:hypothetical protein [Chryseobacterium wangxinyae]|uniref:hypothetical protein n=1 Tax=Chryseobacterium sp. CY353 TaxID=2997334 RepID=UPI002270277D|nr:hypothetical protein [Chryseobacterium sp. CY353]MCY0969213.1 hypothetical protein [Chryseobacterium sp. CY353]